MERPKCYDPRALISHLIHPQVSGSVCVEGFVPESPVFVAGLTSPKGLKNPVFTPVFPSFFTQS